MQNKFHSISNPSWFGAPDFRADYEAAGTWPADAEEISQEDEDAVRAAISRGDTITRVSGGAFVFTPRVVSPEEKQAAAVAQKSMLIKQAGTQIEILNEATDPDVVAAPSDDDVALLLLWKQYRQALRLVDTSAENISWPEQPAFA